MIAEPGGWSCRKSSHRPTDGDYQTANKVTLHCPLRFIGWLAGFDKGDAQLTFDGWTSQDDLAPLAPSPAN